MTPSFWRRKTLAEMTQEEWESLCDGCGKCCLHKFEDADSGVFYHTNVACKLLNLRTCRCRRYATRKRWVPDCVQLTPASIGEFGWLPHTCAYRLLAEGRDLPDWHPLLSGSADSVHAAAVSVRGWAVSELDVDDPVDHIYDYQP